MIKESFYSKHNLSGKMVLTHYVLKMDLVKDSNFAFRYCSSSNPSHQMTSLVSPECFPNATFKH